MTDNEIIKALKCCASKENLCDECPVNKSLKDNCECGMYIASECLSLINRLTHRNEGSNDERN